ncbi:MAG: fibro-slime domain-containing protein [Fibrobacteria bacterium]
MREPKHNPVAGTGKEPERGFVLAFTILLILGVTAISVGTMFNGKMDRQSAFNYKHRLQTFAASDGLMTLLAQEMINGNGDKYIDATRFGTITGKMWTGLPGISVDLVKNALISSPASAKTITSNYLGSLLPDFDYGIKWSGWLIPPLSGNYTFYTRSDDGSEFDLSTDASPANLKGPLCFIPTWVYAWPSSGSGVSKQVPLIGGNRYYFEYYHKQGGGVGLGQMGWDGPDYFGERPITGRYLSQYSSEPTWAGKVTVGSIQVRYQVLGAGQDSYRLYTEAVDTRKGALSDTTFRTPLVQSISMRGTPIAPPKKLWLRVIHYDYRANGSNPEFARPVALGVYKNMVTTKLTTFTNTDAAFFGRATISKPTRNKITPNRNCGLNMWFADWVPVLNQFSYAGGTGDCLSTVFNAVGDGWRNTKYKDSLDFNLDVTQGANTYVYSRMGNYDTGDPVTSWRGDPSEYFPLDKYAVDPAWTSTSHNYGFCTELHTTFQYQSGLKFEFTGDDDVWVYVNDSLTIDLGGVHAATSSFLNLDDMKTLKYGTTYNFDMFQCERQPVNSSSRIVTNIKMALPKGNPVAGWKRDYGNVD